MIAIGTRPVIASATAPGSCGHSVSRRSAAITRTPSAATVRPHPDPLDAPPVDRPRRPVPGVRGGHPRRERSRPQHHDRPRRHGVEIQAQRGTREQTDEVADDHASTPTRCGQSTVRQCDQQVERECRQHADGESEGDGRRIVGRAGGRSLVDEGLGETEHTGSDRPGEHDQPEAVLSPPYSQRPTCSGPQGDEECTDDLCRRRPVSTGCHDQAGDRQCDGDRRREQAPRRPELRRGATTRRRGIGHCLRRTDQRVASARRSTIRRCSARRVGAGDDLHRLEWSRLRRRRQGWHLLRRRGASITGSRTAPSRHSDRSSLLSWSVARRLDGHTARRAAVKKTANATRPTADQSRGTTNSIGVSRATDLHTVLPSTRPSGSPTISPTRAMVPACTNTIAPLLRGRMPSARSMATS